MAENRNTASVTADERVRIEEGGREEEGERGRRGREGEGVMMRERREERGGGLGERREIISSHRVHVW